MKKNHNLPEDRFNNREISWLLFNQRVLEESENKRHPLLERLRFLSISASNLDEFYSVRVAGLVAMVRQNIMHKNMCNLSAEEQLNLIYSHAEKLMHNQQRIWRDIYTELEHENFKILKETGLNQEQSDYISALFENEIFPLLTPMAIDPAHPFPFIPHQGIALIMTVINKSNGAKNDIIIPVPMSLKRFFRLPHENMYFIAIEDIIIAHISKLFPNYDVDGIGLFKILRDTDIEIEEEAEDLVREFETALRKRRRGNVIRLKVMDYTPEHLQNLVLREYNLRDNGMTLVSHILGMSSLSELITSERKDLLFPPFSPRMPERIRDFNGDIFSAIAAKDFIVHHPYESFDAVVQFIDQAAHDPDVVAIKFTLYRTSKDSPIVKSLIEAAENGKNVTAVVELKARFDEAANIKQARAMERAGVQVVFGFVDWKTHAKLATVIRKENGQLRTYTHIGTGNYHPVTAKIYTDLSLFTINEALGRDAAKIFNFVTGYIEPQDLEEMSVSPLYMKKHLIDMIHQEIAYKKAGKPAMITAKMNSLVDPEIIDELYLASQAGVQIHLNIRGICCLKPQVKGLSENITVQSIVGRFLEHARIVAFANGSEYPSNETKIFMSSADWMPRNLNRRVETLVPLLNETVRQQVLYQILPACFSDNIQSWYLQADGSYKKIVEMKKTKEFSAHAFFMDNPGLSGRGRALKKSKPFVFK